MHSICVKNFIECVSVDPGFESDYEMFFVAKLNEVTPNLVSVGITTV